MSFVSQSTKKKYSIAMDGPVGAGKSTLARMCAKALGFIYIDTGALYRAIGLYCYKNNIQVESESCVINSLDNIKIALEKGDSQQRVILNGEDVSDDIRLPEVSMKASAVSAIPKVREFLLDMQRGFAKTENVIMDGRDIGTVVLPNADLKIFITTKAEIRAKRRYDELIQKGINTTFEEVLADLNTRDYNDSHRKVAPLKQAEDAYLIDTGNMDLQRSFEFTLSFIKEKLGLNV